MSDFGGLSLNYVKPPHPSRRHYSSSTKTANRAYLTANRLFWPFLIGLLTPSEAHALQKAHFRANPNPSLEHRLGRLRSLKAELLRREADIHDALWADFKKPSPEVELTEILTTLIELNHTIRGLASWMKPRRASTPLVLIGTSTEMVSFPRGPSLIIAPWNYAIVLTLGPLIHATAAGCPVIIKPSEYTPRAADVLNEIISAVYPPEEAVMFKGGPERAQELLAMEFKHIHFTGSPRVGRIIMEGAAKHLASVTLELGGKSPTYVHKDADPLEAAKGICFGKFSNAGQTCIAPDYLLVHRDMAARLMDALKAEIAAGYTAGQGDTDLASIIAPSHFERQLSLLDDARSMGAEVAIGGGSDSDSLRLDATVLTHVPLDSRIMQEEIFGPILPLIVVDSEAEALDIILDRPPPLSTYVFASDDSVVERFSSSVRTGAVCRNTTLLQFVQPFGPFGGEGNSGIGRSHGEAGFRAFSNEQVVLRRKWGSWILRLLQPPYTKRTSRLSRLFRHFT